MDSNPVHPNISKEGADIEYLMSYCEDGKQSDRVYISLPYC